MIRCIVYCSKASRALPDEEARALAANAAAFNKRQQVTGRLLYLWGRFVQAIEGPPDAIEKVYGVISADLRHTDLTVLLDQMRPVRSFALWSMDHILPRDLSDLDQARLGDAFHIIDQNDQDLPPQGERLLELLAGVEHSFMASTLRMQPRQARAMVTVDRLLGVARQFLMRDGAQDMTVDAVAQAAQVSAPTAYRYFATPADLMRGLVRQSQAAHFQRYRVFLQASDFNDEVQMSEAIAAFIARSYLSDTTLAQSARLYLLRNYHDIAFD